MRRLGLFPAAALRTGKFMRKKIIGLITTISLFALVLLPAASVYARPDDGSDAAREVTKATKVFDDIMSKPDKAIPRELLENATAIGIFPDVLKAAFIFGGSGGEGIVIRRNKYGRWESPAFYDISSGSFGPQIGAKSTDYVMLFMNKDALRQLEDDKLEFGGNVSFAAGPVGRTAGASTNATLDAGILTWSRSKGAFAGVSLKGAVITADNDKNNALYGMNGSKVLKVNNVKAAVGARRQIADLRDTLRMYGGTSTKNSSTAKADAISVSPAVRNSNMNRYARYERYNKDSMAGRSAADIASMQVLSRRVRNELLTLPYYSVFDWIQFDISPVGVVTLNGQVTTPPDTKGRAAAYVKDVKGVTGVVNKIKVLPLSTSDDRLRRALYQEIYSGPLFRYQIGSLQSIHIIVDNGRVTLEGAVDSRSDKNIAGVRANSVPGVFSVKNDLAIRKVNKPQ